MIVLSAGNILVRDVPLTVDSSVLLVGDFLLEDFLSGGCRRLRRWYTVWCDREESMLGIPVPVVESESPGNLDAVRHKKSGVALGGCRTTIVAVEAMVRLELL